MTFLDYLDKTGQTYAEVAAKAGIPRETVKNWYEGVRNPKHKSVIKLAEGIGEDPDEVADWFGILLDPPIRDKYRKPKIDTDPPPKDGWYYEAYKNAEVIPSPGLRERKIDDYTGCSGSVWD